MRKYWTHIVIAVLAFLVGSATVASATGHIQKFVISNEDESRSVKVTKDKRLAADIRGKLKITNLTDIQGPVGPEGPQGPMGSKGSKGNKGNQGDTGLACWDLNGNNVRDVATEDTNNDNVVDVLDVLDCNFSAAGFLDRFGTNSASGAYSTATPCTGRILGEVWMHAGTRAPRTTAFAHGQLLAITQNEALFALLGTIYGGDGRFTFGLPDMRGLEPEGVNYVICLSGLFP